MSDNGANTFTTKGGVTLHLRPIPMFIMGRLHGDTSGMPTPPVVDVNIGGHLVQRENPNDPNYLNALAAWRATRENRVLDYVLSAGVAEEPPPDWGNELLQFFPGINSGQRKAMWVMSLCSETDQGAELSALSTAIVGQTTPTAEGVAASAKKF